ncbi:MAG: hypothetical protein HY053_04465, partial [Proteobacteria bacterium]|nr:hypothetical protein [Pseudomonadota bacterium]
APTETDKEIHPFVFNARQFFKPKLREWFTAATGTKASANPLHSTDNEAEAIGHLPLFFTEEEQQEIFRRIEELRAPLAAPAREAAYARRQHP